MKSEARIAELFERYRPEVTGRPITPPPMTVLLRLAAALGADVTTVQQAFTATWSTLNGWNHFAPGDRVLVFGAPDPATGSRRVRRGTVLEPLSPDLIRIDFGSEGHDEFAPADPVRVCHVAGTCRCVVTISSRKPEPHPPLDASLGSAACTGSATSDGQGQARWA